MIETASMSAPVYCKDLIEIAASPDKVWAVLTDVEKWNEWNNKISFAYCDTVAAGEAFVWRVNAVVIKSVFQEVEPSKALGWRGKTFGASAVHNWRLDLNNGITVVTVEESMDGWLVWLFRKKMNGDLQRDMRFWLEALKMRSEMIA